MKKVSIVQDGRPVSRRGVLGLGFVGTMGLPAMGRAMQTAALPDFIEQRVVECVIWAMCVDVDDALFKAIKAGDFSSVEAHHHLRQEAKDLLQEICEDGADAITTLRGALTSGPALGARTALGEIFEDTRFRLPCPTFPCPWW